MGRILPFRKRRQVKPPRFHKRSSRWRRGSPPGSSWRSSGKRGRWRSWLPTFLLVALLVIAWRLTAPLVAPEWDAVESRQFGLCGERGRPFACVNDGDTVTLGYGNSARRIRLTGFDTPELDGACPAESAKAREARGALRAWLNAAPFEWDGGAEPPYDRYGRELRAARRIHPDGRIELLADTMMQAGLAGGSGWDFTPTNWCK